MSKVKAALFVLMSLSLLISSGCTTRLGEFTALSSQNVRNLDYSYADRTRQRVEGSSCDHSVYLLTIIGSDDRLKRAIDDAIANGHEKGLDGDLLVNVRADHSWWSALVYGQDCIKVEGDLISLTSKSQ